MYEAVISITGDNHTIRKVLVCCLVHIDVIESFNTHGVQYDYGDRCVLHKKRRSLAKFDRATKNDLVELL